MANQARRNTSQEGVQFREHLLAREFRLQMAAAMGRGLYEYTP